MAPIPPVSAARSVSARMRSLSWTAKLRRRGRADNSGDAAAGAGTTVGLRPPFAPSPAAASICLGSMGMTDDPSAPPSLNSRGKMSHLHWHGGARQRWSDAIVIYSQLTISVAQQVLREGQTHIPQKFH